MFEVIIVMCHLVNAHSIEQQCDTYRIARSESCAQTVADIKAANAGTVKSVSCKKLK